MCIRQLCQLRDCAVSWRLYTVYTLSVCAVLINTCMHVCINREGAIRRRCENNSENSGSMLPAADDTTVYVCYMRQLLLLLCVIVITVGKSSTEVGGSAGTVEGEDSTAARAG